MTKIAGSGSRSGSISQRHGSADPDPPQNVMSPLPGVGLEATLQAKVLRPAAHHCLQVPALHSCNINPIF
jgi:hypothetical protein